MQINFPVLTFLQLILTDLCGQLLAARLQLFPVGVQTFHQSIHIDRIGQVVLAIPGGQHMFQFDGG